MNWIFFAQKVHEDVQKFGQFSNWFEPNLSSALCSPSTSEIWTFIFPLIHVLGHARWSRMILDYDVNITRLPSLKLTYPLKINACKMNFLSKWSLFGGCVNSRGGTLTVGLQVIAHQPLRDLRKGSPPER